MLVEKATVVIPIAGLGKPTASGGVDIRRIIESEGEGIPAQFSSYIMVIDTRRKAIRYFRLTSNVKSVDMRQSIPDVVMKKAESAIRRRPSKSSSGFPVSENSLWTSNTRRPNADSPGADSPANAGGASFRAGIDQSPYLGYPLLVTREENGLGSSVDNRRRRLWHRTGYVGAILDLAMEGRITATVTIVNSADAQQAVGEWLAASPAADLGWHPNLTLDRPILPAERLPSLVRADGTFWPLGQFLRRACLGQIRFGEVRDEWQAQYRRFVELAGRPPAVVNSHQHVSLFPPCDDALLAVLDAQNARPYLRRVVESGSVIARVPGARVKRTALSVLGRRAARRAAAHGLPGCDWLIGVTDPGCVADNRYLDRWLKKIGGQGSVEVCCHPGYHDSSLIGRDCDSGDGLLRRPRETTLLRLPTFLAACADAGLVPVRPTAFPGSRAGGP